MAVGFVRVLEASVEMAWKFGVWGDGMGENSFSEKLDVEDAGDVLPPQPKKEPSFEAPGDFCGDLLLTVVLLSFVSFE